MSVRELVVLGTASQVPTRTRNHNGYLLRFDGQGVLFDPGEGTQRQLLLAGVAPSQITAICITHAHGDHCLGLPGVLQRLSLDGVQRPVPLIYPAEAEQYIERLRWASAYDDRLDVRPYPVTGDGPVLQLGEPSLEAAALDHRVPAFGYRLVEPDGRRMLPARLAEAGLAGPDVARLVREGTVEAARGTVRVEDVSEIRRGQRFAFVMDTALCDGARTLAADVDLLVCEATFASADAALAAKYKHLTARQAAEIAAGANARRLVLAHFSQRYGDLAPLLAEARQVFDDVVLAEDLVRIPLPARRP
ncbi:MAG: ribonuclease Z [Actinomycetota bacterium]|nr:ribonuclease Z [Actinomycetota bacterium]